MISRSNSFLLRSHLSKYGYLRPSTPVFSNFDDLINEVLAGDSLSELKTENCSVKEVVDSFPSSSFVNGDGWRRVNWDKESRVGNQSESNRYPGPSPVDLVVVRDKVVYFKRDDLLKLPGSQISGNKARKMYALQELPDDDFPSCVVSYGGPQSNAMLALAAIVYSQNQKLSTNGRSETGHFNEDTGDDGAEKQQSTRVSIGTTRKRFVYYTKKLPRFLQNQPSGNLFRALSLGMELVELSHSDYKDLFGGWWGGSESPPPSLTPPVKGDSLWVPQGGACGMAKSGAKLLAQEIVSFWSSEGKGKPLSVCIPGGTCSTALLVHRALREIACIQSKNSEKGSADIEVVVVPCVGDESYARRQMINLNTQIIEAGGGSSSPLDIPSILPAKPVETINYFGQKTRQRTRNFVFGEPNEEVLATFREMRDEHGVVLDLLYGSPAWALLLRHWRSLSFETIANDSISNAMDTISQRSKDTIIDRSFGNDANPLAGREIMYVHSGGLEGINSQLLRYKYKGLLDLEEIQLPGKSTKTK